MRTAQELFNEAFDRRTGREPRSLEYRNGVLAALKFREQGEHVYCPYPSGTAQADAFSAGVDEGHWIWRHEQQEQVEAAQQPYTG